ncbi:MAG: hypothetical protein LQ343_003449 [Gyalolechia ehrenbergii]|nr:MAG: hypothetical protein LQ343_003449 [Gyalolechia ehrenbergii]
MNPSETLLDAMLHRAMQNAENATSRLGRYDLCTNVSHAYLSHLVKRKRTLDYDAAVCKGEKLYQRILAAFEGTIPPAPKFSQQDIDNGWTIIGDKDSLGVDEDWDEIFTNIGGKVPAESEVIISHVNQWRAFKNNNGDLRTVR